MANFIGRPDVANAVVEESVATEIIQELPKSSVMLTRARQVRMSKKRHKQPVLVSLSSAYWVDGDTGLKQTTKAAWDGKTITAEELAVIVPIPDALIDDSDIPLWDEVRPLVGEALGIKVDEAALFGVDKPDSWPTGIIPASIAAGNTVVSGANKDIGQDVAALGEKIAKQGYAINGFASTPGLQWRLTGLRSSTGDAIYTTGLAGSTPTGLYGLPLNEVDNGAWDADIAEILAADWSKFVVGIRQDITYDIFKEGVISDADGKVLLNLMQQDMKAMRVVMRVGFQVANPITRLAGNAGFPAGVVVPAGEGNGGIEGSSGDLSFDEMTVQQLKDFATEEGIDITGLSKKDELYTAVMKAQ